MSQPHYTPPTPYPASGEVLDGKYRIEKLLGEGGMGAVAKATHMLRRAPVALKFMSPAVLALQGAVERFVNEGVAASQIDSDHVVKVFDVGRMPSGAPYLVMEFLDGQDLGQLLAREGGRLGYTRTVHFGLQILRALQTAHASGIIHRDMKPSNCFVIDKDGEPDFVKLVDFGISKVRSDDAAGQSANLTRTNSALGTPLYMSPEQARSPRDVDHRADLYSVGAILYELLSGRTPYTAESGEYTEILFKIFTTDPEPIMNLRPDIPEGLAQVIHRALVRDPNVRFSSASEMAEALTPFADERSANVIARVRGGRGRSLLPPSQSQAPPGMAPGGQTPVARANTFPHGSEPGRAPRVPTAAGLSKDSGAGAGTDAGAKSSKAPLVAAFVGLVVLCGAAGVVVLKKSAAGPAPTATHDTVVPVNSVPAPPATTASAAPTGSTTVSVATGTAVLEPLPSASPSASGASTIGRYVPPTDATGTGSVKKPPATKLNDIGTHF
ncbi:MAG TPA: serine/threonine-protein kinase [Polyangiaceae bacterium]|jgi:serine/threonine-protein kinase